jgi:hypothetical protein
MPMATGHGKIAAARSLANVKNVSIWRSVSVSIIFHTTVQLLEDGIVTTALAPITTGPKVPALVLEGIL